MAGSAWTNQLVDLIILSAGASGFSGFFAYSPAPGAGNLTTSVTGAAGTDPYGNAYLAGTSSYLAGATYSAVSLTGGAVSFYTAPGFGGPWTFVGGLEIAFTGSTLLLNFTNLAGALNTPQPAVGGTPLTTPAPGTYGVVWGTQVVTAINNLASMLQAAGVSF
jgi:hypothetical protein